MKKQALCQNDDFISLYCIKIPESLKICCIWIATAKKKMKFWAKYGTLAFDLEHFVPSRALHKPILNDFLT